MGVFYAIPETEPMLLTIAPRLASWMARDHLDQLRLAAFLDHVEEMVTPTIQSLDGPLALRLDVGLPPGVEPLKHHDLDNYLFPLVTRLGSRRFVSAWATKAAGTRSLIRVDRARALDVPRGASTYRVRTTRSAATSAWKEEVRNQLLGADEMPEGPVELQLGFRIGPSRNWANLWKQAIDSLDPILGSQDGRPWNPRDGRIIRLGLHQVNDPSMGHSIEIGISAAAVQETTGTSP